MPASLSDLQAFAAVARLKSFRQAATELNVSASALSHTMRNLETRLGVRLLHRTTRSVSTTEAGAQLMGRIAPALVDIGDALDAINSFRDTPTGTLRISAPRDAAQWVLAPYVVQFLMQYPGMQVDLVCDDRLVDIVALGMDAGVRFGERLQQDMVATPLGPMQQFVVVASPEFLQTHGVPLHPTELMQHPCIRIQFLSGVSYQWEFANGSERLELAVKGPMGTADMPICVAAAQAGVGFAYVYAQHVQNALADGSLRQVLHDWCPPIPGFYLYYPSRRQLPAGLKAFIELIRTDQ